MFEEVYLDFEEMGLSIMYIGKVNVLFIVVYKDLVDSCLLFVREVNFEFRIVDMENYVIGNVMDFFYMFYIEDMLFCCINVGVLLF